MKKIVTTILGSVMMKRGYNKGFGLKLIKQILDDIFNNKGNTIKEKIWAHKRGFFVSRIKDYGLTEKNYKNYLSDFDYYLLYPINNEFKLWIDDKLTFRYILQPFKEYLPKYYYQLKNNNFIKLMDCPSNLDNSVIGLISLLKDQGNLALKLISGSLGAGFYKMSYENNIFFINDKKVLEKDMVDFLIELDNYIITEYIKPHKKIATIYPTTPNTLRLVIKNENCNPKLIGGFIKFGTKNSGMIEHIHAGGVLSSVDFKNGSFGNGKIYREGVLVDCLNHPDTGVKIEGMISNWELILSKVMEIGQYIPQLRYVGYDIVVTDEGFKILEINSHSGIGLLQIYKHLMEDENSRDFFANLLKNKK